MSGYRVPARAWRDVRWRTFALLATAIATGGLFISLFDGTALSWQPASGTSPAMEMSDAARQEIHQHFQQGVIMLHAKRYEHAMTAFHKVLEIDPALPEAHVNMGFALIGLERYAAARDFFEGAIALRRKQVNAYYGLAVALDGLHDRASAIGAMRTFVHLSQPDDPYVRRAQAALWEWEAAHDNAAVPNTSSASSP